MTIELADMHAVEKPWGSTDLRPWSDLDAAGDAVGEIWFQRSNEKAGDPGLLFKLLFTEEALSIQVHPDDDYARSIGLKNGKTEAWYVLAATPAARVAVGLVRAISAEELRAAILDQSIIGLVDWRAVKKGDVIFVPAGTIHAIGAGLVIAEVQQRSDATFRLYDHGRDRAIHTERAIAVATPGPAALSHPQRRLNDQRTLLVSCPYFTMERLDLLQGSIWALNAGRELWLLVVAGGGTLGSRDLAVGDVAFLENDSISLEAGESGLVLLVTYVESGPIDKLLERVDQRTLPPGTKGADSVATPPPPAPFAAGSDARS